MSTAIYLAADQQNGTLVTRQEFDNWADAYLASISDGRACFERDEDGYMRPVEYGRDVYSGGSFKSDDTQAKIEAGRSLRGHMSNYREDARYGFIEIRVDADGFLETDPEDDNSLYDAITYGTAIGYKLRAADAARAGLEIEAE